MTTTTEKKTRKIVLSERRPVSIVLEDWPPIASADWFSGKHECQANEVAHITVRQHADGRALVYCSIDSGPGGMTAGYRGKEGGFLLPASEAQTDEIIRAIRRCAGIIDMDQLGDECIADLPAEELE